MTTGRPDQSACYVLLRTLEHGRTTQCPISESDAQMQTDKGAELVDRGYNPISLAGNPFASMNLLETGAYRCEKTVALVHIDVNSRSRTEQETVYRPFLFFLIYIEVPSCIDKDERGAGYLAHIIFDVDKDRHQLLCRLHQHAHTWHWSSRNLYLLLRRVFL